MQSTNFQNWLQGKIDAKMNALIVGMEWVGNECLREMREPSKRGYKDRTANLRSSTGYVIAYDGNIIKSSGFVAESSSTGGGDKGSQEGSSLAESVASTEANKGLALILVAGMNYAVYVERMGLNVLDSAKLLARAEVDDLVKDLLK